MFKLLQYAVIVFFVYGFMTKSFAQNTIHTHISDRPGKFESADIAAVGTIQYDNYLIFEKEIYDNLNHSKIFSSGSLFRFGINEFLEFRLGGELFLNSIFQVNSKSSSSGLRSPFVGTKINLFSNNNATNGALLFCFILPLGERYFAPKQIEFGTTIFLSKKVEKIGFDFNSGMGRNSSLSNYNYFNTLAMSYSIEDSYDIYIESSSSFNPKLYPSFYLTGGMSFSLFEQITFSLFSGTLLRHDIKQWIAGVEFSLLLIN